MSYNGIGLSTPRGSGTNGYVTRNISHVRPAFADQNKGKIYDRDDPSMQPKPRKLNKEIAEHDKKRKVEVRCFELRDKLEDEGYGH